MASHVAFDLTHIVSRLPVTQPSGIDKVDTAYLGHFAKRARAGVHYGLFKPRCHDPQAIRRLAALACGSRWVGSRRHHDTDFKRTYQALTGVPWVDPMASARHRDDGFARRLAQVRWRLAWGTSEVLPQGAVYLNVAQHAFEYPGFFRWLDARPDVKPVFLVHDLLPVDYPEYFKPGYDRLFRRRFDTIVRHARGLITTTQVVADRVAREYRHRGLPLPPMRTVALPATLPASDPTSLSDPLLAQAGYFLIVGTIEPRKNHLLLLNTWRQMIERGGTPPKLVIVGARGWENEQVLDVLDRSARLRPFLIEAQGIGDEALATLMANARALLCPSFAEGYGLPVVEALSVGTPVVASDIAVFREVSQGRALFRHPLDGPGWRSAIEALADRNSTISIEARAEVARFEAPRWTRYFEDVDAFLASLG